MSQNVERYVPIFGMALGGIVFFMMFDCKILQPTFVEWTLSRADPAQHFLGWHFFRSEPRTFPLGTIKSYLYPEGTNIVYTDSIPLLAIPLKIVSPFLPPLFQFKGFWLLLCYLLQGYFSSLLVSRISNQSLITLSATLFFLLSPVLVARSYYHEALSAHWIILAALYLYFQVDSRTNRVRWVVLLIVAAMVHFYLLAMSFIILSGYLLRELLQDHKKNLGSVIQCFTTASILTTITMWAIGYFTVDIASAATGGFGYYSMNLIAPFKPTEAPQPFGLVPTTFLAPLPVGQYEGFNYLGLGMLLLLVISGYAIWRHKDNGLRLVNPHLPLILVACILVALSISNKVMFGNVILYEVTLPHSIARFLGIIRSSGRMFWPVSYMLILAAITIISKYHTARQTIVVFLVCLCLQIVDLFPWYSNIKFEQMSWHSALISDSWDRLMQKANHLVFLPAEIKGDDYVAFALLAAKHGKTINVGYVARSRREDRKKYAAALLREFQRGTIKDDSLYIVNGAALHEPSSVNMTWGVLDGYFIVGPKVDSIDLEPCPVRIRVDGIYIDHYN